MANENSDARLFDELRNLRLEMRDERKEFHDDLKEFRVEFKGLSDDVNEVKVSQARMEEKIIALEDRETTPPPKTSRSSSKTVFGKGAITLSGAGLGAGMGGAVLWLMQKLLGH